MNLHQLYSAMRQYFCDCNQELGLSQETVVSFTGQDFCLAVKLAANEVFGRNTGDQKQYNFLKSQVVNPESFSYENFDVNTLNPEALGVDISIIDATRTHLASLVRNRTSSILSYFEMQNFG